MHQRLLDCVSLLKSFWGQQLLCIRDSFYVLPWLVGSLEKIIALEVWWLSTSNFAPCKNCIRSTCGTKLGGQYLIFCRIIGAYRFSTCVLCMNFAMAHRKSGINHRFWSMMSVDLKLCTMKELYNVKIYDNFWTNAGCIMFDLLQSYWGLQHIFHVSSVYTLPWLTRRMGKT